MASYDVIIIGGGPGGYVSAIRCAHLSVPHVWPRRPACP